MHIITPSTIILLLLSSFINISCSFQTNKKEENNEIILKIGSFEVTRYEYEKNRKKHLDFQNNVSTKEWLRKFMEDSYFLADAYSERYDTISSINKKVNYGAVTMLGQYKGYLWNEVEEPKLSLSDQELMNIYRKQDKLFDLVYVLFPNKMQMASILDKDTVIKTATDFERFTRKCRAMSVKIANAELLYPFNELEPAKERIYELKRGSIVTLPFSNGKMAIAHVRQITEQKQNGFADEKEKIYANFRRIKEKQIVHDKQNEVFSKANINIYEEGVDALLNSIKQNLLSFSTEVLLSDTLMTYLFEGKVEAFSVSDFVDYYLNNPFSYKITDKKSLDGLLKDIVIEKYLYLECVERGITNNVDFILDKRDYKNRLILDAYYKNNFYSNEVSEKEMRDYYGANQLQFRRSKSCYASIFAFKDKESAYYNLALVNKIVTQGGIRFTTDTSALTGLEFYQKNFLIDASSQLISPESANKILAAKKNTVMGPLEADDHAYVFIKMKEEGWEIQPFELVRETVRKTLEKQKAEELKSAKLKELVNEYSIAINEIQPNE